MSDKSNEYGYVGTVPDQNPLANKGVFNSNEIYDLVKDNKWTTFGQLEHIQTITLTDDLSNYIEFNSLGDYDIHLLVVNNNLFVDGAGNDYLYVRFLETATQTEHTAADYEYAQKWGAANASNGKQNSFSTDKPLLSIEAGQSQFEKTHAHIYFYNLTDATDYSYYSYHGINQTSSNIFSFSYGAGALKAISWVTGIRLRNGSGANFKTDGIYSLYGIRYA